MRFANLVAGVSMVLAAGGCSSEQRRDELTVTDGKSDGADTHNFAITPFQPEKEFVVHCHEWFSCDLEISFWYQGDWDTPLDPDGYRYLGHVLIETASTQFSRSLPMRANRGDDSGTGFVKYHFQADSDDPNETFYITVYRDEDPIYAGPRVANRWQDGLKSLVLSANVKWW